MQINVAVELTTTSIVTAGGEAASTRAIASPSRVTLLALTIADVLTLGCLARVAAGFTLSHCVFLMLLVTQSGISGS